MSDDDIAMISASLGNLSLSVQGDDPGWVNETFEDVWESRLKDAEQMAKAIRDGTRGCE